jgi:hypothetical protein
VRNGFCNTTKYLRGAAGIGLDTTIKCLRRTTSVAAGSGLDTKIYVPREPKSGRGQKFGEGPLHKGWASDFFSYASKLYFTLMELMTSSMPPPHLLVKRMAFA